MQLPLTKRMSHAMHTELDQHLAQAQAGLSCEHVSTIWYSSAVVLPMLPSFQCCCPKVGKAQTAIV